MNTKQTEIPAGTAVRLLVTTRNQDLEIEGEFAGFTTMGNFTFLAIQETTLAAVKQKMIPLHSIIEMEFIVKLSSLV
jgi:hypothetical protein